MWCGLLCLLYLLVVSVCDVAFGRIPNSVSCFFALAALAVYAVCSPSKIVPAFLCGLFFFSVFFFVALLTKGLGFGDAKMSAVVGFSSGFFKSSFALLLASFIGVLFFSAASCAGRRIRKIPFAPFAAVGYVLSEIFCWRF